MPFLIKKLSIFRDIARILEPDRSELDIERESLILAEKKLVGKVPVINLGAIEGLPDSSRRRKQPDAEAKPDTPTNGSGKDNQPAIGNDS